MLAWFTDLMQSIANTYHNITPDWLEKFTPVLLLLMVAVFYSDIMRIFID